MIKVENLWKSFKKNQVLRGLNLEIPAGETLVIIGRSGVGKSVLLKQLIGIEKPDRGRVIINGVNISELEGTALYQQIKGMGMLFQGAALFDSMTIGENTAFYLRENGAPDDGSILTDLEIEDYVAEALNLVGLAGTQNLMPSDLSGGMRKRAGLARLIVYRPKILLYDEPTTGLDPITAMQINELIVSIQQRLNATSVVVTHDLCSAFKVGDRIAFHNEGKIAHIARKNEFAKIDDPLVQDFLRNGIPRPEIGSNLE